MRIRPVPKLLAQLSATSNTPVITDVRWLEDCKTIAFLGKSGLLQQQIYVADIESGRLTQLTHEDHYVSGFDIAGDTMIYTTLQEPGVAADSQAELVDVTGRNIFSLLWRDRPLDEEKSPNYSTCPISSMWFRTAEKQWCRQPWRAFPFDCIIRSSRSPPMDDP